MFCSCVLGVSLVFLQIIKAGPVGLVPRQREPCAVSATMRVIIVGGSIAGTACAHALLKIGCEVIVFERATSVTAAGAVREHSPVGWGRSIAYEQLIYCSCAGLASVPAYVNTAHIHICVVSVCSKRPHKCP